jgi:hypothetical protein
MSARVWTDEEVSNLLWTAVALRYKRDPLAEQFWNAAERFALTEDAIESRRIRREAATAFTREYAWAVRGATRITQRPRPLAARAVL